MRISKNFRREEFACKCCGVSVVDVELVSTLEEIREYFDSPITINSGYRCEAHNRAIGGAKGSKHKLGIAADIVVKDVPPAAVADYLDFLSGNRHGIGQYKTFTHIDVRELPARWSKL